MYLCVLWRKPLKTSQCLSLSHVWLFVTTSLLWPWHSPGKNTRMGFHSLLQGIFPTQRLNLGLLHCRQILYHLSNLLTYNGEHCFSWFHGSSRTHVLVWAGLAGAGWLWMPRVHALSLTAKWVRAVVLNQGRFCHPGNIGQYLDTTLVVKLAWGVQLSRAVFPNLWDLMPDDLR